MLRRSLLLFVLALACAPAAADPKGELVARHQGLLAALNRRDMKALRGFYTADYRAENGDQKHNLDQQLNALARLVKSGAELKVTGTLHALAVKGDTATAVEVAELSVKSATGQSGPSTQRSQQRWKKAGGVWKLAWERAVHPPKPLKAPGSGAGAQ